MAVWNETTTTEILSTRRIDAEFSQPHYVEAERRARSCGADTLGTLGSFVPGPFGSAFRVRNYDFQSPYRYIRGQDVKPFFILDEDRRFIPESDFFRLKNYAIKKDDVMISVVGTLGNVAICTERETPAMFSCKSTLFRSAGIDPYYLLAFLNSHSGQLCLLRRQRGAIQMGLNIEDLRSIPIPRFSNGDEGEIASKVRASHDALVVAKSTFSGAIELLESEFAFHKPAGTASRFSTVQISNAFNAGRFDAQCFAPAALFLDDRLRTQGGCIPLSQLIQGTAKGRQYDDVEDGAADYCSIKHISGRELVGVSRCFPDRGTVFAARNDLLLAVTGATIGKVGIVKRYSRLAFSGDLLRLRANCGVDPHYLLAVLNHELGQIQFHRWITGSTNGHLAPRDVRRVLVPRLKPSVEKKIAELVEESLLKKVESERLLEEAKARVEQLIEEAVKS